MLFYANIAIVLGRKARLGGASYCSALHFFMFHITIFCYLQYFMCLHNYYTYLTSSWLCGD